MQLQAVEHPLEPDDLVSLYRLFGFALFVSIRYRKRVIYSRLKHRSTRQRKQLYHSQLAMLKALVETDKSTVPACIKFQDRGKMMFPCKDMYLQRALRRCVYAPKAHSAAVPIHVYARTHHLPREATQVHTRVRLGGRGL